MTLRWFLSSTVRHGMDVYKHIRKILHSQRDILTPQAFDTVNGALTELKLAIDSNEPKSVVEGKIKTVEEVANKWLKQYPNPGFRENIEVFLVAIAVAMAIRTFFLQPFKIPTGSMQPTLYGVTSDSRRNDPTMKVPNLAGKIVDACVYGTFYHHQIAEDDGEIVEIGPLEHVVLNRFINKNRVVVRYNNLGQKIYTFWMTPDDRFDYRAQIAPGMQFKKGEDIVKFKEITGDHLFVDRVTYNFRHPERGEIIVFATKGLHYPNNPFMREDMPQDQFYIKRLIGLGGETIAVGDDRHVRINGNRLDAGTPHFENLYSFTNSVGTDSEYSGHTPVGYLGGGQEFSIRPRHYFAMGDNTVNSSDSRYWGDLPEENVIGKPCFIYWPVSRRFGWGYN